MSKHCDNCGKSGVSSRCSACQTVYYCNKQCQSDHWKNHKTQCKLMQTKNKEKTQINIDDLMKFRNSSQLTNFASCLKQFMDESNSLPIALNNNIKQNVVK
eukprot:227060_1